MSVLAVILIGGFIAWKIPGKHKPVTLEFWSVFDDTDQYASLIGKFQQTYPWIEINYKKFTYEEYEQKLLESWATGKSPDIFSIHNTWLPKPNIQSNIYPLPQDKKSILTATNYGKTFMPVAEQDFVRNGQIYAIPLSIDTLALYYNEAIFEELYRNNPDQNWILTPPKTWDDFIKTVNYVTKKDEWSNIERAGAALGTYNNINRASDILALIMIQSGTQMISSDFQSVAFNRTVTVDGSAYNPGEQSLKFYTDFANPRKEVYTWNIQRDYSIDDFSEGDVAMTFGYSHLINTLKQKNPDLRFKTSPMPQIKESKIPVNYANYWGQTVSRLSQHPKEAWQFLVFASQTDNLYLYLDATNRPTSRMDMISWQETNMPQLGAFARQGLTAQSWYQIDTNAIEKIFLEMIEKVNLNKTSLSKAINDAAEQINIMMAPAPIPPKPMKMPQDLL